MACIVLCSLLFNPCPSSALQTQISDLLVTNTPENILVYFRVTNCFTHEMEEAILAGIPTTFTFSIELYQERSYWTDRLVSSHEIRHTIKYDSAKKLFFVTFSDQGTEGEQFDEFTRAKTAMSDVNGITVAPVTELSKNRKYYVRVKAELEKIRLPLSLEYVFFFVSLWDFKTDWYQQEFVL